MRVLMLSWEYPPKIVGGIALHVEELARALAALGDEVHVVTCEFPGAPTEEIQNGVHIHRVTPYEPADNFIHWVHQLNAAMRVRADALLREWTTVPAPVAAASTVKSRSAHAPSESSRRKAVGRTQPNPTDGPADVGGASPAPTQPSSLLTPHASRLTPDDGIILHAHDWLAYFSAVDLKHAYKLPLVATIHATEYGRNSGIHNDIQRYINEIEWRLSYEAWRVIVCSHFMRLEVEYALRAPWDKMDVIPNGIHAEKFDDDFPPEEARALRAQYAMPYEKAIFFVGRGTREKGAHVLIDAFPKVRAQYQDAKLVIVGGGYRDHLKQQAYDLGVGSQVLFTGFVSEELKLKLFRLMDVACFPSLYEPFGIVALEAMAAGAPVVVSDAGGLTEVVEHDVSGTVTYAGNSDSLAWGIARVLKEPGHAYWMADNARRRVREIFNWDNIAQQTRAVYDRVWAEYLASGW